MTPEELYEYDVSGYILIEDAIEPDYLRRLNERLDAWEQIARQRLDAQGPQNRAILIEDILNQEPSLIDLVVNPKVLPYVDAMVTTPRLKSTWATFKWKDGYTGFHSNHTPSRNCNFYHFNGRIHHNLFQVFYAMKDIGPGQGALEVVPGSHKANYALPSHGVRDEMKVEIPMKAGSVLLFTHDMHHGSYNATDTVRRTIIFTYCPAEIANSFVGDTLYDRLFEQAPENSWLKYLLRRPHGCAETYPRPEGRPFADG